MMCYHSKAQEDIMLTFLSKRLTDVRKPHCLRKKQETTKTEPDQEQETLMTQDIEPVSDMTETDKTTKPVGKTV